MNLLGFDTATSSSAVGLRLADGRTLEARDDPAPGAHPGHATRLLNMAEDLLAEGGIDWGELDRLAVGVGPGTFTGLRVGVATARGLARSGGLELVGVSSLRALAHGAGDNGETAAGVLAVIDARRGEVFASAWAGGEERLAPSALAPELVGEALARAGLDAGGMLSVGDGAVRYRGALVAQGAEVPEEGSPLHRIRGRSICDLALTGTPGATGTVLPDYRRRPDAELTLAASRGGGGQG